MLNSLTDYAELIFKESLMGHMVHLESLELEIVLTSIYSRAIGRVLQLGRL